MKDFCLQSVHSHDSVITMKIYMYFFIFKKYFMSFRKKTIKKRNFQKFSLQGSMKSEMLWS